MNAYIIIIAIIGKITKKIHFTVEAEVKLIYYLDRYGSQSVDVMM